MPFFRNKLVILKYLFPFSAFFRNKSSPAPDKTQATASERPVKCLEGLKNNGYL